MSSKTVEPTVEDSNGKVWKIGKLLGSGSFGKVYSCHRNEKVLVAHFTGTKQLRTHVITAVYKQVSRKVLLEDEIQAYQTLSAAGVAVPAYYGRSETGFFMERYHSSLEEFFLRKGSPQTLGEFMSVFEPMLRGVIVMAEKRILHRDIKPENILVTGSNWRNAKFALADFGFQTTFTSQNVKLTEDRTPTGTLMYVSAESELGFHESVKNDLICLGFSMVRLFVPDLAWADISGTDQKLAFQKVYKYLATIPEVLKEFFDEVYSLSSFSQKFRKENLEDILNKYSGLPYYTRLSTKFGQAVGGACK